MRVLSLAVVLACLTLSSCFVKPLEPYLQFFSRYYPLQLDFQVEFDACTLFSIDSEGLFGCSYASSGTTGGTAVLISVGDGDGDITLPDVTTSLPSSPALTLTLPCDDDLLHTLTALTNVASDLPTGHGVEGVILGPCNGTSLPVATNPADPTPNFPFLVGNPSKVWNPASGASRPSQVGAARSLWRFPVVRLRSAEQFATIREYARSNLRAGGGVIPTSGYVSVEIGLPMFMHKLVPTLNKTNTTPASQAFVESAKAEVVQDVSGGGRRRDGEATTESPAAPGYEALERQLGVVRGGVSALGWLSTDSVATRRTRKPGTKDVIVVTARADTPQMFYDASPGMVTSQSGVAALLTAFTAMASADLLTLTNATADVVFAVLGGDSTGLASSTAMFLRLSDGPNVVGCHTPCTPGGDLQTCPLIGKGCNCPVAWAEVMERFSSKDVRAIVSVDQILASSGTDQSPLYAHIYGLGEEGEVRRTDDSRIARFINCGFPSPSADTDEMDFNLTYNKRAIGDAVNAAAAHTPLRAACPTVTEECSNHSIAALPPSTIHAAVRADVTPSVGAVVVSGYSATFPPTYGSVRDTEPLSPQAISAAAGVILSIVTKLAALPRTGPHDVPPQHQGSSRSGSSSVENVDAQLDGFIRTAVDKTATSIFADCFSGNLAKGIKPFSCGAVDDAKIALISRLVAEGHAWRNTTTHFLSADVYVPCYGGTTGCTPSGYIATDVGVYSAVGPGYLPRPQGSSVLLNLPVFAYAVFAQGTLEEKDRWQDDWPSCSGTSPRAGDVRDEHLGRYASVQAEGEAPYPRCPPDTLCADGKCVPHAATTLPTHDPRCVLYNCASAGNPEAAFRPIRNSAAEPCGIVIESIWAGADETGLRVFRHQSRGQLSFESLVAFLFFVGTIVAVYAMMRPSM